MIHLKENIEIDCIRDPFVSMFNVHAKFRERHVTPASNDVPQNAKPPKRFNVKEKLLSEGSEPL